MNRTVRTLGLIIISSLMALAIACNFQKTVQVGSHTVTVSRYGTSHSLNYDKLAAVPVFEYEGVNREGRKLKVKITGDKVYVHGEEGTLSPGDRVFIGDDGVRVNDLDYGESQRYLRANNPSPAVTATISSN